MMEMIVEAGLFAPYAQVQPWHFTVVQNPEMLERINSMAKIAVQKIPGLEHMKALAGDPAYNCLYHAPALLYVSAMENTPSPDVDSAAAAQNMLLMAES